MYSDSQLENTKYYGKRVAKWALGRDHMIRPDRALEKVRLGTRYGGWFIYQKPLRDKAEVVVLSFGIGNDISFDNAMIEKYHATVYAFDPTPMSMMWLEGQKLHSNFHPFPLGIAAVDGEMDFGLPLQVGWDSYSVLNTSKGSVKCQVRRVPTILRDIKVDHIDVMKMDIEGSEFEVVDDMISSKIFPDQLLVEFHYNHNGPKSAKDVEGKIELLRGQGYLIYDVSPWGREFSMVKRNLVAG